MEIVGKAPRAYKPGSCKKTRRCELNSVDRLPDILLQSNLDKLCVPHKVESFSLCCVLGLRIVQPIRETRNAVLPRPGANPVIFGSPVWLVVPEGLQRYLRSLVRTGETRARKKVIPVAR